MLIYANDKFAYYTVQSHCWQNTATELQISAFVIECCLMRVYYDNGK